MIEKMIQATERCKECCGRGYILIGVTHLPMKRKDCAYCGNTGVAPVMEPALELAWVHAGRPLPRPESMDEIDDVVHRRGRWAA